MDESTLAWAAGFIDGEGWLGFNKVSHPKRLPSYTPALVVGNTCNSALLLLQAAFGGSVGKKIQRSSQWKPIWYWALVGNDCRKALILLLPHLVVKGEQAKLLLSYPSRRTVAAKERPSIFEQQQQILEKLKQLNKRGA